MKKVILAVLMLAVSGAAMAVPMTLIAHNQRSNTGTLSTLIWNGSNTGTSSGMAVGAVPSTATWDWDGATLTGTGLFFTTMHIATSPLTASVIGDEVTDLVVNTSSNTTTAASYVCHEGNFLAGVGAHGCGNVNLGYNGVFDSALAYNVGGNANCVNRTIGGDDISTGNPRGLTTAAASGGCDAVDGAFDLWTILQDDSVQGGLLILSNGIPITSPGTNYMTFEYAAVPLPAALWLFGGALGALGVALKRKKATT